jgi:hypothetical protein
MLFTSAHLAHLGNNASTGSQCVFKQKGFLWTRIPEDPGFSVPVSPQHLALG